MPLGNPLDGRAGLRRIHSVSAVELFDDPRTFRANAQVEADEAGVGLEALFRRPGETLDDQAEVVGVRLGLAREGLPQGVFGFCGFRHGTIDAPLAA
jgi:hypothetical protein